MKPEFIILDRDGVINEDSDAYIKSIDEWVPIQSSIKAIALLSKHNIPVAIATNQSGIGRGYYSTEIMQEIHIKLKNMVKQLGGKIQHIAHCPHLPKDNCNCRKPKTGMIEEIQQTCNIKNLRNCYFIGDSHKDILAARTAGCLPVLVKSGKGKETLAKYPELINEIPIYHDLLEVVTKYLKMD
ncbi:D-glycero-beta-D-manno-heptose 1,7-bisphosphate 7-phosphatase [Francisellaceae bacterium]|nr:D-glycero-beta-D-manno-heptose 1,7-bisphosphate 7-phosphatase [Francisellaceae bacterium]